MQSLLALMLIVSSLIYLFILFILEYFDRTMEKAGAQTESVLSSIEN